MKVLLFCVSILYYSFACSQSAQWERNSLNTAKDATYLTPAEKEMIYEINRLRSDPPRYARLFIKELYEESLLSDTMNAGTQYSVTTTYINDVTQRDTVWMNSKIENKKALKSLYDTLLKMSPLSVLLPDKGIYNACVKHAKDQKPTGDMGHRGTDGSWPWDRIKKASPKMKFGNENLACGPDDVRGIVLQLLIDSGIDGYGHRYNLLNPFWTHAACRKVGQLKLSCQYWIQNFGEIMTK